MAVDDPAVVVRGLRARLGNVAVLRDLTFEVKRGERLAIFGPNGAGKTTLLRALAGMIQPTAGEILFGGASLRRAGAAARARMGVLFHQTSLYGELTVQENLELYGRLYEVERLVERSAAVLEQVGLYGRRNERVDTLSRGLQQRLAIGRAVLHEPCILLLDEPDTGLDLQACELLETVLLGGDQRRTVIMASHNLDQARRLCERALVLVQGRLVADVSRAEFQTGRIGSFYGRPADYSKQGVGLS